MQLSCPRCGQAVWLNPQTNTGACACGQAVSAMQQPSMQQPMPGMQPPGMQPPGMQQPMPGMQPPGMQPPMPGVQAPMGNMAAPMPGMASAPFPHQPPTPEQQSAPQAASYGAPKRRMAKLIAGVVGVAVLGLGGTFVKKRMGKNKPGKVSYRSLSIDSSQANPDELIDVTGELAIRWRRDANWWKVNFHGVRTDGTIDLSSGGTAQITYISPSRVTSAAKSKRKDSLKKFRFSAKSIDYRQTWDSKKAWKNITLPGEPSCGVHDLAVSLAAGSFKSGTLHVSFDPQFAFVTKGYAWRVESKKHPELDGRYSMVDCSLLKAAQN